MSGNLTNIFFSRIDSYTNITLSITNSLFSLFAAINTGKSSFESCFFITFILSLILFFYLFKLNFIVIFIAILSLLLLCNMFSVALMYNGFVSYISVHFFLGRFGRGGYMINVPVTVVVLLIRYHCIYQIYFYLLL